MCVCVVRVPARRALPSVCVCVSSSTIRKDRVATVQSAALISMGKRALADLSADEKERRERQRALQVEAIEKRSRGEAFVNPTKKKRKPLEARRLAKRLEKRKAENAAKRREVQKKVKEMKASAPEIIIVPVFWKGEAKQMARVLSVCADVEAALASMGKRVMLDAGHKYTPGQKFAHWEHKGVRLRVEVGPREAERGCCTVARTFKPGEPAHRVQRVPISAETLPAELEKLDKMTREEESADGATSGDEDGGEHEPPERAAKRSKRAADSDSDANDDAPTKPPRRGGDDLEDDFADADAGRHGAEEDEEDDDGAGAKKARKPKGAKSGPAPVLMLDALTSAKKPAQQAAAASARKPPIVKF